MGMQYIYANAIIKWQNTKWDLAVCGAICMGMLLGMDFHLGPGGCLGSGDWCHHILQIHWLHTTQLYCFLETGSRQQREAVVSLWGLFWILLLLFFDMDWRCFTLISIFMGTDHLLAENLSPGLRCGSSWINGSSSPIISCLFLQWPYLQIRSCDEVLALMTSVNLFVGCKSTLERMNFSHFRSSSGKKLGCHRCCVDSISL